MKKIVFSAIICLLLVGLSLPSCTPGTGNEPLNLDPGGIVSGVDGVSVGAPEGALDQAIQIFIEIVDDPSGEVPFPEYLGDIEVVGEFYGVSAEQDFSTPDEDCLLLGLPVPEGISADELALVVLVPPDWIIVDQPDHSPSLRWIPVSGVYDPGSELYCTLLPSILTEQQVFALLDPATAGWADWTDSGHFRVVSVGFNSTESPEAHRVMTADALNDAYAAYVEQMGFLEPNLRNPIDLITFTPDPTVILNVNLYEYQLQRGAPNGFYSPATRTAGTYYLGAPDEPNPLTAPHELFHAIQFAYPALDANYPSWELQRTMEAAATAAELSLEGLTRSNRPLNGRDPLPVTRGLWSSPTITSFDYAAQDFLVYLGRVINPSDPQLEFMIPWFEQGGLVADLDAMLQAETTFNSLGDAYWQWVKNHAFEKQVILGKDSAENDVPNGEACSWSGHGDLEHVSFSPETWTWGGDDTDFTLGPLTSRVFELTLNPGDSCYGVTLTIDSGNPDIEFKFYEAGEVGGEDCWDEARDSVPHTFYVGEASVVSYLIVSNTNLEMESDLIRLVAAEEELECTPMVTAGCYHTVGLKYNGTVVAVGRNDDGQCNIDGWADIIQVSAGSFHTAGLKDDGTVVAVGRNNYGQCNVTGWANIEEVAAGNVHTVGLKDDGTVVAVGNNDYGQCDVDGWTDIIRVAAGYWHAMGLKADGTVISAGWNNCGQRNVDDWTGIIRVAGGGWHTVGLRAGGTVVAVGKNTSGQCDVGDWTGIIQVAAGYFHTLGLRADGTVIAVGWDNYGQCAVGSWTDITQISAGCWYTVGLKDDGTVVAMGQNDDGQCNVFSWTLK